MLCGVALAFAANCEGDAAGFGMLEDPVDEMIGTHGAQPHQYDQRSSPNRWGAAWLARGGGTIREKMYHRRQGMASMRGERRG